MREASLDDQGEAPKALRQYSVLALGDDGLAQKDFDSRRANRRALDRVPHILLGRRVLSQTASWFELRDRLVAAADAVVDVTAVDRACPTRQMRPDRAQPGFRSLRRECGRPIRPNTRSWPCTRRGLRRLGFELAQLPQFDSCRACGPSATPARLRARDLWAALEAGSMRAGAIER